MIVGIREKDDNGNKKRSGNQIDFRNFVESSLIEINFNALDSIIHLSKKL